MDRFKKFFQPKSIAIIGATETKASVGLAVMHNLTKSGFRGKVIPIHPKRERVCGIKTYKSVLNVPDPIDLAVIITPAKTVPLIIKECAQKQIPTAIILSAGFREIGDVGIALEKEILDQKLKMRIIGPNCLGIMNPSFSLNATFAADCALDGDIAFISQSGALGTAVLDWSLKEKIGFSAFISIGSMIDVDFGDLIDFFGKDKKTKSIIIYMESIGDAQKFLSAAKKVALSKPIILIKAGRSEESIKAAASHTGALAGSDEVFSAAMRRAGVLRVNTIGELFGIAEALSKQPMPKGPRLTIITNAGGPAVIATDALIENGGKLAPILEDIMLQYSAFLPPTWSHNNPIDILGDASPDRYKKTVEIAAKDPNTDGLLVILTPQDMTNPTEIAKALKPFANIKKPVLASFMGAKRVEEGSKILAESSIPVFAYPDLACKTFATMWNHSDQLIELQEELVVGSPNNTPPSKGPILDEVSSKKILEQYGIPTVKTEIAKSADEAVKKAKKIGFPIVLKLFSKTITHKTDVGGVKLNLKTPDAVVSAFNEIKSALSPQDFDGVTVQQMINQEGIELILGSITDKIFGPVVLFGHGGTLVEVIKDQAIAMPTLTKTLAKRLMRRTNIYKALRGIRGRQAVDLEKLQEILVHFSKMITEQTWIDECDINPLLATSRGIYALDARMVVRK